MHQIRKVRNYSQFDITVYERYQYASRNQKSLWKFLTLDEKKLAEQTEGECYKYLGQDENTGHNDVLNKERVIKEYLKRIRKIWSSELYSNNKIINHNSFAIPVLTPTFGIIK